MAATFVQVGKDAVGNIPSWSRLRAPARGLRTGLHTASVAAAAQDCFHARQTRVTGKHVCASAFAVRCRRPTVRAVQATGEREEKWAGHAGTRCPRAHVGRGSRIPGTPRCGVCCAAISGIVAPSSPAPTRRARRCLVRAGSTTRPRFQNDHETSARCIADMLMFIFSPRGVRDRLPAKSAARRFSKKALDTFLVTSGYGRASAKTTRRVRRGIAPGATLLGAHRPYVAASGRRDRDRRPPCFAIFDQDSAATAHGPRHERRRRNDRVGLPRGRTLKWNARRVEPEVRGRSSAIGHGRYSTSESGNARNGITRRSQERMCSVIPGPPPQRRCRSACR